MFITKDRLYLDGDRGVKLGCSLSLRKSSITPRRMSLEVAIISSQGRVRTCGYANAKLTFKYDLGDEIPSLQCRLHTYTSKVFDGEESFEKFRDEVEHMMKMELYYELVSIAILNSAARTPTTLDSMQVVPKGYWEIAAFVHLLVNGPLMKPTDDREGILKLARTYMYNPISRVLQHAEDDIKDFDEGTQGYMSRIVRVRGLSDQLEEIDILLSIR